MTAIEKAEKINNAEFQIMTDSDSCKKPRYLSVPVTKNHECFWRYGL
jgi:hypothetical protein